MCGSDGACEPCKAANAPSSAIAIVHADKEIRIWGPMSVEVPSDDKKLIRLAAVERALPGLLRRGRFTMMHNDMVVGEVSKLMKVDQARLPKNAIVQAMVNEVANTHGGLPTGIIQVTQSIAAVFPKLKSLVGKPVAFAGGTIYEDDRIGKTTREEALAGRLDSFSISGASFKGRPIEWCDPTGCAQVEEVPDLDLSTITLCSSTTQKTAFGQAKARNPGAAFIVVQQADATSNVSVSIGGIPITVENGKGTVRSGVTSDGIPWQRAMNANYGYVKRTEGADGDEVDVYVGDNLASDYVLVINQLKKDGSFDEHKVMLGFDDLESSLSCYKSHYPIDFVVGPAKSMTVADFKEWLKTGDQTKVAQADMTTSTPGINNQTYGGGDSMPFAGYTDFDDCVAKNGDKNDPKAYCSSIMRAVEQADKEEPPKKQETTIKDAGEETLLMELRSRVEQVEQDLATLKGQKPTAPAQEDEEKGEEEKPSPTEEGEDEMSDEPKKTEQATTTTAPTAIVQAEKPPEPAPVAVPASAPMVDLKQALVEVLKDPAVMNIIKQAMTPPAPESQSTPTAVRQATRVETPEPAPPTPASKGSDDRLNRLVQAIDSGQPGAFREFLEHVGSEPVGA